MEPNTRSRLGYVLQCLCACLLLGASLGLSAKDATVSVAKGDTYDKAYHDQLLAMFRRASDPLSAEQLAAYETLLRTRGWPTEKVAGRDGIDAAGELLLRAGNDYAFQEEVLGVIGEDRLDRDVDALGWMRLSDEIQVRKDGTQQFGTLVRVEHGRLVPLPESDKKAGATFWRDFYGLPSKEEHLAQVRQKLDRGLSLAQANPAPRLSQPFKPYTRPDLREELGRMIEADQDARHAAIKATGERRKALMKRVGEVDHANRARIRQIFAEVGFPTPAMVGRDGTSTAFLLVQHADSDPAFQAYALRLAKPLVDRHEFSRLQYAYLTDRVRLNQGKKQLYGSQARIVDGKAVPLPVENPAQLDQRRSAMSMGPEADYLKALEQAARPHQDKQPAAKSGGR